MKHKITLEFDDQVNAVSLGFRQSWIDGESGKGKKKTSINLSCGAGVGSPWLLFSKTANGKTRYFAADIRKVVTQLSEL